MIDSLKDKVIGVPMGGLSAEREVSMKSGRAVASALKNLGYNIREIDLTADSIKELLAVEIDVAFVALHGRFGEDGAIQGMLELLRIPYTGSSHSASAVAMNKLLSKQVMVFEGIMVTPFEALHIDEFKNSGVASLTLQLPLVVKPVNEGSSIGVSIVRCNDELFKGLEVAFEFDTTVLVEKFIKAREIQVGILNDKALGVIEIIPKNEFYDFDAKYSAEKAEHVFPAKLPEHIYNEAMELGLKAHRALGCSGGTRTDLLLGESNEMYVLEVNSLPGMTELSLLPEIAGGVGIEFPRLCEEILRSAKLNIKSAVR